jgi:hypothetical protein
MSAPELSGSGEIRGDVLWPRRDVSEDSDSNKTLRHGSFNFVNQFLRDNSATCLGKLKRLSINQFQLYNSL